MCPPNYGRREGKVDAYVQTFANIRAAVEATYVVSLRIAKCKKPHIIGEELVVALHERHCATYVWGGRSE